MYLLKSLSLLTETLHLSSLSCKFFKFIVILVIGWWHHHQLCGKISAKKFDYFFLWIASTITWSKFIITLLILFETKDISEINLNLERVKQSGFLVHLLLVSKYEAICKWIRKMMTVLVSWLFTYKNEKISPTVIWQPSPLPPKKTFYVG